MDMDIYTLQDFYTHTKGVLYLIMLASIAGIGVFWQFLTGRDKE